MKKFSSRAKENFPLQKKNNEYSEKTDSTKQEDLFRKYKKKKSGV